jgi:hypothetical protein
MEFRWYPESIQKAKDSVSGPKYDYEICFQYLTLARTRTRWMAHLLWAYFRCSVLGRGVVLLRFYEGHYVDQIRPVDHDLAEAKKRVESLR